MATFIGVSASPDSAAHTHMAAEALRKVAADHGHTVKIECQGPNETSAPLEDKDLASADLVILALDKEIDQSRFSDLAVYEVTTSRAITDTAKVLNEALLAAGLPATIRYDQQKEETVSTSETSKKRIVAVTSCPTGIAHTFMAADALKKKGAAAGHDIKVETQGSVGAKDQLSAEDIAAADVVIISADTHVDESRFAGKPIYRTTVGAAVKDAAGVIQSAFTDAETTATPQNSGMQSVAEAKAAMQAKRSGPYKHLLTGVSYMLPVVVAGGLLIALSFIFGIEAFKEEGTLAAALMTIGGGSAFKLMVPVLAGFIAFSIADRPGLTPGLIGGLMAVDLGAGFLGGIVAGFLAGYVALWLRDNIKLPSTLEGLKPVLILPLLSTLVVGLTMIYVVGEPVRFINESLTAMLQGMGQTNAVLLGLVLGAMMAFDMGGPVNKAAYAFSVGLLSSSTFAPMAAVMAAGMTPPLGLALATFVAKNRFDQDEREAGKAAAVLGLSFITEGAIPYAAKDPLRVIPSIMVGSALTGALSMFFASGLRAPHGGVFVLAIPNAVSNLPMYILSILIGTVVTAAILIAVKRPISDTPVAAPAE
ncbi:PTS fructose-like transporter subunit IIB [Cohaesibacter celericrescens]|uniref:protein-N(pi)-phosphohistidine--D-fructose phosphotransferase n=1 Tax=Cohaesibacter celericrescens TaxID=2067669 RepID=A0A2N5XXL0_9HYPH|nr:PTS fructose-like transporter subunit IIB [Cohaesibacter celericrescens]PLW79219.1 PTS fructose transporter subunit EIIBC [Cohaesibacter celericrescens]